MSRPTLETESHFPSSRHKDDGWVVSCEIGLIRNFERERDEAREIARELRNALTEVMRVSAPHMRRIGDTHVIKVAEVAIQKAKEVLG